MWDGQGIGIDLQRCTGCAACIAVCPADAITLADSTAHVDPESCTGCGACVDACPEGAIQPVVVGELVPAQERQVPIVRPPSPLAETVGAVIVATGVSLLKKAAEALVRAVGHWLSQPSTATRASTAKAPPGAEGGGGAGRGRRARHRRRGG